MKLFKKIKHFIRGTDKAETNNVTTKEILEYTDSAARKIVNRAEEKTQEALKRAFPGTATQPAQMSVASLEDAIDQLTEGMVKAGFKTEEAADAIRSVFIASVKPEPLSHLTNNWRKMHGLPMHRKPASFRRRRRCLDGRKGMEPGGTDPARRIDRKISARHGSQEAEPVGKCGLS